MQEGWCLSLGARPGPPLPFPLPPLAPAAPFPPCPFTGNPFGPVPCGGSSDGAKASLRMFLLFLWFWFLQWDNNSRNRRKWNLTLSLPMQASEKFITVPFCWANIYTFLFTIWFAEYCIWFKTQEWEHIGANFRMASNRFSKSTNI